MNETDAPVDPYTFAHEADQKLWETLRQNFQCLIESDKTISAALLRHIMFVELVLHESGMTEDQILEYKKRADAYMARKDLERRERRSAL